MKKYLLELVLFTFLISAACDSTNSNSDTSLKGVYVLNEGNFGQANASVTVYNAETGEVAQNIYENQNGVPIGDVLYSVTEIEDRLYLVVNNSNKIVVVDRGSLTRIATINIGLQASPRELVQVNDNKAYVTNLFGNSVSVIDLESNEEISSIPVGANPEGIAVVGNLAYVANSGFGEGNTISVIDTNTDEIISTITVGDNPTKIIKQDNDMLWVVCVGAYGDFSNPDDDTPGTIYVIDGATGNIVSNFEVGGHPGDLVLNDRDDIAYLVNGSLMSINMNTYQIIDSTFINRDFYSIGLSTSDDAVYLWGGDAKNFAQAGVAIQYDINGVKLDSFPTGIIPGAFYFSSE